MATEAPVSAKDYNGVIGRATLRGIWMTEAKIDVKPQALDADLPALQHEVRTEIAEVVVDSDGIVYGFIRFAATGKAKRTRVIQITGKYFVSYCVAGGCDQEIADLFMRRVGRLAAYPYFRALAASLASQAGLSMPPLPIMSFQPRNVDYVKGSEPVD